MDTTGTIDTTGTTDMIGTDMIVTDITDTTTTVIAGKSFVNAQAAPKAFGAAFCFHSVCRGSFLFVPSAPMIPPSNDQPLSGGVPPASSPPTNPRSGSIRHLFAVLLSLCLVVFLVDGVVSFT